MIPAIRIACAARISRWASPSSPMNSSVAPRMAAAFSASRMRSTEVPRVPDSPCEQTTRCTGRQEPRFLRHHGPAANSSVVGVRAKRPAAARVQVGRSVCRLHRTVDGIAVYKSDFGGVVRGTDTLFAGPGDIMGAVDHRLNPAQAAVARGADLFLAEVSRRQRDEAVTAFVAISHSASHAPRANHFPLVGDIDEEIRHVTGGAARNSDRTTVRRGCPSSSPMRR